VLQILTNVPCSQASGNICMTLFWFLIECTLAKWSYKISLQILVCHNLLKYYQNKSDKTDNDTALSYNANKTSKWEAIQQTSLHASSLHKPTTGNCSLSNQVIPSMLISTASPHIEALGSQFVDLHIARYDPILTLVKLLSSSKAFRQSASTRSHALHNQNNYYWFCLICKSICFYQ
jgi:hypothetical protein